MARETRSARYRSADSGDQRRASVLREGGNSAERASTGPSATEGIAFVERTPRDSGTSPICCDILRRNSRCSIWWVELPAIVRRNATNQSVQGLPRGMRISKWHGSISRGRVTQARCSNEQAKVAYKRLFSE